MVTLVEYIFLVVDKVPSGDEAVTVDEVAEIGVFVGIAKPVVHHGNEDSVAVVPVFVQFVEADHGCLRMREPTK